jgi:plasmid stability protein
MTRMPTLYIRNVPPEVYEALKARAKREGRSVNAEALVALEEVAERERGRVAVERFLALAEEISATLPPDSPPAEEVIRQLREERDRELMRRIYGGGDD